jgi:hypothetical protein
MADRRGERFFRRAGDGGRKVGLRRGIACLDHGLCRLARTDWQRLEAAGQRGDQVMPLPQLRLQHWPGEDRLLPQPRQALMDQRAAGQNHHQDCG